MIDDEYRIERIPPRIGPPLDPVTGEPYPFLHVETMSYEEYCARFGVVDASGRIVAPPQTPIAERPDGPHRSNGDARKPVRE